MLCASKLYIFFIIIIEKKTTKVERFYFIVYLFKYLLKKFVFIATNHKVVWMELFREMLINYL